MAWLFLLAAIWQFAQGDFGWGVVWFVMFLLFKD